MRRLVMLIAGAGLVAALSLPAAAGDYVYADSFGNLVVESAAGYKRIVVGQGQRAKEMAAFVNAAEPQVVYVDGDNSRVERCYRPGAWVKGRSHMYGLSDGELPYLADCQ